MLSVSVFVRPFAKDEQKETPDFDEIELVCNTVIPTGLWTSTKGAPTAAATSVDLTKPGSFGLTDIFVIVQIEKGSTLPTNLKRIAENKITNMLDRLIEGKLVIRTQIVRSANPDYHVEYTTDRKLKDVWDALGRADELIKQMRADKEFLHQRKRVA